jgi:hypothetical protein
VCDLTPFELSNYAAARQRAEWDRAAALLCMVSAIAGKKVSPEELNPYRETKRNSLQDLKEIVTNRGERKRKKDGDGKTDKGGRRVC